MKRFLLNLLQFAILAMLTYVVLIFLWGDFAPTKLKKNLNYKIGFGGHLHTRLQDAANHGPVDVLFLGSSHAYRGFDVRIFERAGIKCFNLGSSGQSPIQSTLLLDRYLERLQPRIVVFEVFPRTFCSDGVESSLDIIANARNDWDSVAMAMRQGNMKVFNTLIYGLLMDAVGRNESFREPTKRGRDRYISGGFVERMPNPLGVEIETDFAPATWEVNEIQFQEFNKMVTRLKAMGITLILIQAPITTAYYDSYSNNDDFDRRMEKYGNYYNFNKSMNLDDKLHFYDSHHLSQVGVQLFNAKVVEILHAALAQVPSAD
jgi:hypothetical protein